MPTAAAPTPDPAPFPGFIRHYPEHRLLFCQPCSAVVFPKGLCQHLRRSHQLPTAQRKLLVERCWSLDLITQSKDLQLQPDYSPALSFLSVHNGYSCSQGQCRFLTFNRDNIRQHVNQAHKLYLQACTNSYKSAQLQSWFRGSRAKYWIVTAASVGPTGIPTAIRSRPGQVSTSGEADELYRLEQQEIQRLEQLEQDCIAQEAELEDSDNSDWLRWNQWPAQFAGLPLDIIAASAVQPEKGKAPTSDYILGPWAREHFISPIADEVKLQQLV
jgi:Orsellinic acid/F9775 biosynthesis cluster protein D